MEIPNVNKFKNISKSNWDKITEIIAALEPVRKSTRKLQYEQLTIGSFYCYWKECKLATEKVGSDFARKIIDSMIIK